MSIYPVLDETLTSSQKVDSLCNSLRSNIVQFPQPIDENELRDSCVFITGGASGLGAAFTQRLLQAGAYVVFSDINETAGKKLEKELHDIYNHRAYFVQCDVTSWESQVRAFKQAIGFFPSGTIDHVIPGAGVAGEALDLSCQTSKQEEPKKPGHNCIDISLIGTLYSLRLAAFYMGSKSLEGTSKKQKSIVMIDSVAGYGAIPTAADYTSSKFGVRGIFKSMVETFKCTGIRLNMIAPGYIKTPLITDLIPDLEAAGIRFAEISTAVHAVMVLISSSVHGRSICVSAEGLFDLRDDLEGLNGGIEFVNYIRRGNIPL